MNCPFLVTASLVLFFMACGDKNQPKTSNPETPSEQDSSTPAQQYFPVMEFLKGEIAYVDSLPVGIMKYTHSGSKTDSGYIKPDEFHELTAEFLTAELIDSSFEKHFEETSFLDKTSNNATFYYSSRNEDIPVRRVDVVMSKGEVFDEVKSIYIEKNYRHGESSLMKKLFWKPKRNFQIITVKTDNTQKPENEFIKVVWDNRE